MTLDDTKAASVMATADRTADPGAGQGARTRRAGPPPARDGLVAPPGLLPHHARGKPQPDLQVDLHISVITDLHSSMDIGSAGSYRATTAHAMAYERASRPKPAKLATNPRLRRVVQDD